MLAFLKIEGAVSWQSEVRRMIYIYIYACNCIHYTSGTRRVKPSKLGSKEHWHQRADLIPFKNPENYVMVSRGETLEVKNFKGLNYFCKSLASFIIFN